eukprot:211610_1
MESATLDKDLFVNEWDISILDDDWLPPGPQRDLLYSFHKVISATNYRLDQSKTMNEGALDRCDFKLNNIDFNYETGYFRLETDLKNLIRQIHKFTKQSHKMINKFESMENAVIPKQDIQWIIEWPSPVNQSMISNYWPNILQSPTHEIGCCWWHCQIRKVPFYKYINNEMYYKLGIFVGPKHVVQLNEVVALKCKLKVIVCIKYKEMMNNDKHDRYTPNQTIYNKDDEGNIIETIKIEDDGNSNMNMDMDEESLEVKTDEIAFDVETDFIKIQDDGNVKVMSWGKFIPELQDIIDAKTGNIPHESVNIEIKYQVIDQCVTYKHSKTKTEQNVETENQE